MKPLTRLQSLEKQNKDLRIRLENRSSKAELAVCAMEDDLKSLKSQIREKDQTIAMLQKEVSTLNQELCHIALTQDEIVRIAVENATAPIICELEKANVEIKRLKAIINKDSSNSSNPPSKDGFKKIPNNREPSEKPKGGQIGHPGHRLGLPNNLDELVEKGIVKKEIVDHTDGTIEYVSRYVIDVHVQTTITEHRFSMDAKLPLNLYNEVSYGDNIKSMSTLLLSEGIIAENRWSKILSGLTGNVVNISPATLERYGAQFAQKLVKNGELDAILKDLLNGEVLHTDDTPISNTATTDYMENGEEVIRQAEKTSFNTTVRTHSNETSTLYTANPKKNMDGIERDNILPRFFGILSHDHESKFYNYGTFHATCGTHLLRALVGLRDLKNIIWADDMRKHISKMNQHKKNDINRGKKQCDPTYIARFEKEYDDLIKRGKEELKEMKKDEFGYHGFNKMLNRLTNYKDCYLLFIRNYKAPFSNNQAEQDLRMEKTKEKVSGLFRSWQGVNNHVKIRSFISTVKKRKQDLYSAILKVNQGISVLKNDTACH